MALAQLSIMSTQLLDKEAQETADEAGERALMQRVAAGDKRAFESLFSRHGERVFRYAYRLISDATKAEEVTNDVMLEVWKNAAKYEGRSKVSTWLLGITRHLALNAVRRKQLDTIDMDDAPEVAAPEENTSAREQDGETLRAALRAALDRLSPEHRDVVELTFFHECSYQEIAEIVNCPTNTVKTRMFHAKKQLQGFLLEAGLDPSSVEMAS